MATIAYILLCHKDPDAVIAQVQGLISAGDCVAIHFDGNASAEDFGRVREALAGEVNVTFARRRLKCGWGDWSLVSATMETLEAALESFPHATHFYLLSGDCAPIKSARYIRAFLEREDADYIESVDFHTGGWIKTGIKEERLIYRHYLNERRHKWLFYQMIDWQRRLGLVRKVPVDLQVMIGSQWWCLRRTTVEAVLAMVQKRRDVVRFFSTTWIPDEVFFQTLVRHLVPEGEIKSRPLTFLMFTDYGLPVTFYNDQYDLLLGQDYLFARKISPEASDLKRRLAALYTTERTDFAISAEGRSLFDFLTGRGRIGHRFAPRFWENEASLGRGRELLIVVSKKWDVATRLVEDIESRTGIRGFGYLFHSDDISLPDLGGIQSSLFKRARHRRATLRMLYDYYKTDRMMICLDPGDLDLIRDFCSDRAATALLVVDCDFDEAGLTREAKRRGMASELTTAQTLAEVLPALRDSIAMEHDRIRDEGFANQHRLRQSASVEQNAKVLARFLAVSEGVAHELAEKDDLFSD